jgi:replication factor A1
LSHSDIIGIVQSYKPLSSIKTRAGNDLSKRSIEIIDSSNRSIELTLWGERAENFVEAEDHPVIACKSVKVGDFGGKNLSVLSSSQVEFNPDLPKAHELRAWYDGLDPNSISTMIHSLSNTQISGGSGLGAGRAYPDRTLADVRDQGIGKNATEYFTIRATIMALKSDKTLAYMACANPTCSKKVVQIGNQYQCDKCNKPYPTFKWRYIFQMSVADHTNNQWVNVFNDTGEAVLGVSADDLMGWKENNDPRFEQVMDQARYQSFICKASAAEETYMDERRVRVRLSNAQPITGNALIEDSRWLLTKIKEMQGLA